MHVSELFWWLLSSFLYIAVFDSVRYLEASRETGDRCLFV